MKGIVNADPPSFWEVESTESESMLERRMVKKGNRAVTQWLIKWKGEDIAEATWEDAQFIREKFSKMNLAGRVVLKGEGMSGSRATPPSASG